ncbi:9809_t:CDS:1, partial [Acaulospora morrowiae]
LQSRSVIYMIEISKAFIPWIYVEALCFSVTRRRNEALCFISEGGMLVTV